MFHPPKPETLARLARERREASEARSAELRRRLAEKAATDPDGPWGEMLSALTS